MVRFVVVGGLCFPGAPFRARSGVEPAKASKESREPAEVEAEKVVKGWDGPGVQTGPSRARAARARGLLVRAP